METAMVESSSRTVVLRDERDGRDSRHLAARLTAAGDLRVDGLDVGPTAASLTGGVEYEWTTMVRAEHLPGLVTLLGGDPGVGLLCLLAERYTGPSAYDLEQILSGGAVPIERSVWAGG
jgi:hypothetical protein